MPDDIKEIPFGWIAKDLAKGDIIPFLGAGASAFPPIEAKPPSAAALAMTLARDSMHPDYQLATSDPAGTDATSIREQAQAYLDCTNLASVSSWVELVKGDRDRIRDELRDALAKPDRPLPYNNLHSLIANVACEIPLAIITTNYDDLMEQALEDRWVPYDLYVVAIDGQAGQASGSEANQPSPRGMTLFRRAGEVHLAPVAAEGQLLQIERAARGVRLKRTAVFKLHGNVGRSGRDEDTFVITEEDYVRFLGRMGAQESLIPSDLVSLMLPRRMLFLGYGLRDWNLRVLLDRLAQLRTRKLKSVAIARNVSQVERRLWNERSISVFDVDLAAFVQRLSGELAALAPPQN